MDDEEPDSHPPSDQANFLKAHHNARGALVRDHRRRRPSSVCAVIDVHIEDLGSTHRFGQALRGLGLSIGMYSSSKEESLRVLEVCMVTGKLPIRKSSFALPLPR